MKTFVRILVAALCAAALPAARAQILFSDTFENGLGQWTGKNGGAHQGVTVPDPLASGHGNVLSFTGLNAGGDIYSTAQLSFNGPLVLSFDYLGQPSLGGPAGNLGGFLGVAYSLNPLNLGSDHLWLAGTENAFSVLVELIDDGAWHHYDVPLNGSTLGTFRLMIEDYDGSFGSIAGDAQFDNLTLTAVPEPSTATLLAAGIAGFRLFRIRRRRV